MDPARSQAGYGARVRKPLEKLLDIILAGLLVWGVSEIIFYLIWRS